MTKKVPSVYRSLTRASTTISISPSNDSLNAPHECQHQLWKHQYTVIVRKCCTERYDLQEVMHDVCEIKKENRELKHEFNSLKLKMDYIDRNHRGTNVIFSSLNF